jgi:hypothetical protein
MASGHRWLTVCELRRLIDEAPQTFAGLSQAALAVYLGVKQPSEATNAE